MVDREAAVIAVAGAKGGVGATTFAQTLACVLSKRGEVLTVDADEQCQGDMARSFGMSGRVRTAAEVMSNGESVTNLITGFLNVGFDNIGLIQTAPDNTHETDGVADRLLSILKAISKIYSYVVVDFGADTNGVLQSVLPFIHRIIVITGVDPSSLVQLKRKVKMLRWCGVDNGQIDLLVNGWRSDLGLSEHAVGEKIGGEVSHFLPVVNGKIIESLVRGVPLAMDEPSNPFVTSVGEFSDLLSRKDVSKTLVPRTGPMDGLSRETGSSNDRAYNRLKERVLEELLSTKEIKKLIEGKGVCGAHKTDLEHKISSAVRDLLDKEKDVVIRNIDLFIKDIVDEAIGLGPLEVFMTDPEVTEIMVNARDEIYIEKGGKLEKVTANFASQKNITSIIERIVSPLGRRVDESSPVVDARLPDGSRVHVIIPPLSLKGPTITIRKFKAGVLSVDNLVSYRSLCPDMAHFLKKCVQGRVNILVSGGTGSGKTTMLNVLSSFIPPDERIITIEDSAELKLRQPHVVRLESRPPNIEGKGEVAIRDLVKASLRMRPDRIIVGEVRSAEALDMLQAMNTGHDGSLTTIHANSCRDSISRLETLVLFSGYDLPLRAIREQMASAIGVIVQLKRLKDGSRKVVNISEITGMEGQTITMQELFVFDDGEFISTGFRPKCLEYTPCVERGLPK